jgi:hypothetical protein
MENAHHSALAFTAARGAATISTPAAWTISPAAPTADQNPDASF